MDVKEFWNWFVANHLDYERLDQLKNESRDDLLDKFEIQLHKYCDQLYFEIGGEPDGSIELIITAEGNIEYFKTVENLIACAPDVPNWEFIAFKPQVKGHFKAEWGPIELDTNSLCFNPSNKSDELGIAIIVYVKDYRSEYEEDCYDCLFKMLDTILGEKSFALDIKKVIIESYDPKLSDDDVIPILKLPDYVRWYKAKYN
ncbi:hypothetical protein [Mucilaginibacter glaciei]|uniref:Uncharacterized protein n=1 Tax=Mucilaginibacter glaciei TaxID=2772109 RepID=A0A926NYU6_9SPHI|nr:hypothetical protein [Mucilaginibacter glaciei]MBD1394408.1 hypothetical protein [Mucilaginibacter glaciei]